MSTGMKNPPPCVCGKNNWQDAGASLSPDLNQLGMICLHCDKFANHISGNGGNIFIIPTGNDKKAYQPIFDWVNKVVIPTWRARYVEIKAARKILEDPFMASLCEKLGIPLNPEWKDIPEDKQPQWQEAWDEFFKTPAYINPPGFDEPPIPAQMPEGVVCSIQLANGEWRTITREETLNLVQPPDPIRVQHDAFFNTFFEEFAAKIGVEKINRYEVKNEYCGADNQPWYTFMLGKNKIKIGPRKRVYAVKVNAPQGFETKKLRDVVVNTYNNTYYVGNDWHSELPKAESIEVHAWDKDQLMEFLCIISEQSFDAVTV